MSMTRNEIIDLLTTITGYDNRKVGEAGIAAWLDAAQIGQWTPAEADVAARRFLNDRPDEWLKPGHVTQLIRHRRRDALEHAPVASQAPDPGLMRRLEALADSKAVDAPTSAPRALPAASARRHDVAGERVEEAMRRGEAARLRAVGDQQIP